MKKIEPEISVIIPLYNNGQFVIQAVQSVLDQKGVTLECIVVDDGSSDKGGENLKENFGSQIKIIRQSNKGVSAARNRGAKAAKGAYLAFLDADDFWAPTKLQQQIDFMIKNPDFSAVYCQGYKTDEKGKLILRSLFGAGIHDEYFILSNSLDKTISPALGSTILIKKDVFLTLEGFDTELSNGEDRDFRLRMSQNGFKQHMLNKPLAFIRIRENSVSHSLNEFQWELIYSSNIRLYKKLLSALPEGLENRLVKRNLNRVLIRHRIYFQLIGKEKEFEVIGNKIVRNNEIFNIMPVDFYKQIEFFTPLVFQKGGRPAVMGLVDIVLADLGRFIPGKKDLISEEIVKIKTDVWCSRRSDMQARVSTFGNIIKACRHSPRLILRLEFWKEVGKLIIGDPFLWFYTKMNTIS